MNRSSFRASPQVSTTKSELVTAWGEPAESSEVDEGALLLYNIEPFAAVEALVDSDDVVATIKVTLAAPLEPGKLAEQLSLNQFEPVTVLDDEGQPLGQAFPERGVLFMYDGADADALPVQKIAPADGFASGDSAARPAGLCSAG